MNRAWTITDVARHAGRSTNFASQMARAGLLPGYQSDQRRGVPAEHAAPFIEVLRYRACSPELATLMGTDPSSVLRAAESLAYLARAALADQDIEEEREAA